MIVTKLGADALTPAFIEENSLDWLKSTIEIDAHQQIESRPDAESSLSFRTTPFRWKTSIRDLPTPPANWSSGFPHGDTWGDVLMHLDLFTRFRMQNFINRNSDRFLGDNLLFHFQSMELPNKELHEATFACLDLDNQVLYEFKYC